MAGLCTTAVIGTTYRLSAVTVRYVHSSTLVCVVNEYETSCDDERQDIGSVNCDHLPVRKWIVNVMLSIVLSSLTSIIDSVNIDAHHCSHRHT